MNGSEDPASVAKTLHVPTYDEILGRIKSRFPRSGKLRDRELSRLQLVYDTVISKTDFIPRLVRLLDSMHPFYWRLVELEFSRDELRSAIKCLSRARKISSQLYDKYKVLLLASIDRRELLATSKEARGRILSTVKRCSKKLEVLRRLVAFLQELPSIDASLPTIIIAGAPSTGKSTVVKTASRAKPKVAPYPFTTTTVHVGHTIVSGLKVQLIDTPGLLDRPLDKMNKIEKKAVAALNELKGAILFLVEPTDHAYASLESQFNILVNTVKSLVKDRSVYVAINKIDIANPSLLAKAKSRCEELVRAGEVRACFDMIALDKGSVMSVISSIVKGEWLGGGGGD